MKKINLDKTMRLVIWVSVITIAIYMLTGCSRSSAKNTKAIAGIKSFSHAIGHFGRKSGGNNV